MANAPKHFVRGLGGLLIVLATASGCTTFVQPTACEQGSTACGGIDDARFCDVVATAVEGADCQALGVVAAKHVCVVTSSPCVDTDYAVKGRDCRVVRYVAVRDSSRAECSFDTPTFAVR
jgi:hypothetical protein